ncbi:MAG: lamin tail domain-containing protein [Methanobacteriota archaeon]|nr:MAG: lamin tail domain-containing protein [Euryarchaeota archaeon]
MSKHKSTSSNAFVPVVTAVVGVVGTIAVAYFTYLGIVVPKELEISATQTAEYTMAKNMTAIPTTASLSPSVTPSVAPTETILPPTATSLPASSNLGTIAISEVMANPCGALLDGSDVFWNEYVELYNYGDQPIDVNGWWISDGEGVIGNPDMIVSWQTRYPGISFGYNLETATSIIPPGKVALILSPKYLVGDTEYPQFFKPYIFPEGTIILTIANGDVLGSDDFGIEVVQIHNPVILYQGTESEIGKIMSTYGSPILTGLPTNIKDDEKDGIPIVLNDCYAAERIIPDGPDVENNWRAIKDGSPGQVPSEP